jgi:hypothetical protein
MLRPQGLSPHHSGGRLPRAQCPRPDADLTSGNLHRGARKPMSGTAIREGCTTCFKFGMHGAPRRSAPYSREASSRGSMMCHTSPLRLSCASSATSCVTRPFCRSHSVNRHSDTVLAALEKMAKLMASCACTECQPQHTCGA